MHAPTGERVLFSGLSDFQLLKQINRLHVDMNDDNPFREGKSKTFVHIFIVNARNKNIIFVYVQTKYIQQIPKRHVTLI